MEQRQKELTLITMGDSITWGYCVTEKSRCYAGLLAARLRKYCDRGISLINQGIGANVLTPLCPSYEYTQKPCGIDRVYDHCIRYNPDIVVLAFGVNDCRSGLDVYTFISEYQRLIEKIKENSNPLIVITSLFYIPDIALINLKQFDHADRNDILLYNKEIENLCKRIGAVYADVYSPMEGCDHLIDGDNVHPNDIGHELIADSIFCAIARYDKRRTIINNVPSQSQVYKFMDKYNNGPEIE